MGALGGAVIAPVIMPSYNSGLMMGLKGFAAAVLGGMGSSTGAILAGFLIGVLESVGAGYVSSAYKDAFAFVILLLILFLKPSGLLGARAAGGDKA